MAAKINQPAMSDCRSLLVASRDQPPGHTAVGHGFSVIAKTKTS